MTWSPDGRQLATASIDHTVRIWDADNGSELVVLRGHDDDIRGLALSPNGRQLATASDDRTVRIWDTESGAEIIVIGTHAKAIEGAAEPAARPLVDIRSR